MYFSRARGIFDTLANREKPPNALAAEYFSGNSGPLLGIDNDGNFYILLPTVSRLSSPGLRLRFISVDYSLEYSATIRDQKVIGNYAGLVLSKGNEHLLNAFCRLFESMVEALPMAPSNNQVRSFIDEFVLLLTPRAGNLRDKVKGLFAELSFIKSHPGDFERWIRAWHDQANATKDFSDEEIYVEIKCTEGAVRKHSFSLPQVLDNDSKPTVVCSYLVQQDPQGESVLDLVEKISSGTPDLHMRKKINSQVISVLGQDFDEAGNFKFVVVGGEAGVWCYRARDLPRPELDMNEIQIAISKVSFDINFEILDTLAVTHCRVAEIKNLAN